MGRKDNPKRAAKDAYYQAQATAQWLKGGALAHPFTPSKSDRTLCKVCAQEQEHPAHAEE